MSKFYHNFASLGYPTKQTETKRLNQLSKESTIIDYTIKAIQKCPSKERLHGCELFCADSYYSNYIVQKYDHIYMDAIDNADKMINSSKKITKILENEGKINIIQGDVFSVNKKYDFILCCGGLYHISNPFELLNKLKDHTSILVIQTVITLKTEDEDYFVTPAPCWTWGSRFTFSHLLKKIKESGWNILESSRNKLKANHIIDNQGSAYILCINEN
jgi:hypothetical protein